MTNCGVSSTTSPAENPPMPRKPLHERLGVGKGMECLDASPQENYNPYHSTHLSKSPYALQYPNVV